MSAETAAILDEAANVIRRNGLHQGSFCDDGPLRKTDDPLDFACCTYLAANHEHPRRTSDRSEAAYGALVRHLGISDELGNTVADWNDAPDRTAEQVIAALEAAARAEREAAS